MKQIAICSHAEDLEQPHGAATIRRWALPAQVSWVMASISQNYEFGPKTLVKVPIFPRRKDGVHYCIYKYLYLFIYLYIHMFPGAWLINIYIISLYMKKKAEPFPLDNVLLLNLLVAFPLYMSIFWSSTCPHWKKEIYPSSTTLDLPRNTRISNVSPQPTKRPAELSERNLMRLWMSFRTLCSKMLETQSSTWPWKSCLVRGHMEKVMVLGESKTSLNSVGTCNVGCAKHVHKNTDLQTSRITRWRNNERYHPPPHPPHPRQTSRTTRWRNNERYHPPPHPPHPRQTSRTRRWHKDKKWNSARPLRGADTKNKWGTTKNLRPRPKHGSGEETAQSSKWLRKVELIKQNKKMSETAA